MTSRTLTSRSGAGPSGKNASRVCCSPPLRLFTDRSEAVRIRTSAPGFAGKLGAVEPDQLVALAEPLVHDLVVTMDWDRQDAIDRILIWVTNPYETITTARPNDAVKMLTEVVQTELHDRMEHTSWPPCPDHPHHPLWLNPGEDVDIDELFWYCPTSGRAIAQLGGLTAATERDGRR